MVIKKEKTQERKFRKGKVKFREKLVPSALKLKRFDAVRAISKGLPNQVRLAPEEMESRFEPEEERSEGFKQEFRKELKFFGKTNVL